MEYAIIQAGGRQYKVVEGQEIVISKLKDVNGDKFVTNQVLLVRKNEDILIGRPYVANAQVEGKIIGSIKGEKIKVIKFKGKVRYRRAIGFRSVYSKVLIEKISLGRNSKRHNTPS